MINDKKAQHSTGFAWIYSLVSLFGLGILYIVFSQVFKGHLVPTIKGMVNGTLGGMTSIPAATQVEIVSGIDKYMSFFDIMPFILVLVIIIYMVVAAVRRERSEI